MATDWTVSPNSRYAQHELTVTLQITVLLVDDEPLVRAGLRAILEAQPDIEVVGEAADGAAVVPLVRRLRPDVIAMDVRMPLLNGIEATRAVLRSSAEPAEDPGHHHLRE